MVKTLEAVILFLDSRRGTFIPRDFAQCIKREAVEGVNPKTLDELAKEDSPESEDYWELWQEVLANARVKHENGYVYHVHQDGDVWLYNYDLMTQQERENFGFEED